MNGESLDPDVADYLDDHRAAAMITTRPDGSSHAVRCGIALVDGRLWSSGTRHRRRTAHLRRDPRCTLFVFGASADDQYSYLTLDTTVTVLDGDDAAEQNWQLFSIMQAAMDPPAGMLFWNGAPLGHDEFLQAMVQEQRLIYQFDVERSYGLFGNALR
ncbi:pyridoxamine 5'-phosphate oxidase family protein [Microlunatus soli]|uniref:Pyridoxamine 5'-phosphate oxidase n=1 Tax=Microlunatus soli TaxID=630515 RepID=A0A1H1SD98_9ACTN|nr:pyridoxamine 5'-phosphate oxidase family protein [Microlunatus soli]SDS45706.1 Pyridoxamine 5'-phosphate oxidase [Microlunatus soli]